MYKISEIFNVVCGDDIGDAWLTALDRVIAGTVPNRYLTIHVDDSLQSLAIPETTDLDDWASVVNVSDVFDRYCDFDFEDESKVEGTTGRAWIESRIYEISHHRLI